MSNPIIISDKDYPKQEYILVVKETPRPLTATLAGRTITKDELTQTISKQTQLSRGGYIKVQEVNIVATAYCNDYYCTGDRQERGITASGRRTSIGIVATPSNIPFGSKVEINGLGMYDVADRGNPQVVKWLDSNTLIVDIWMENHKKALDFGRQKFTGRIYYVK
jgi:3D (Asp-Asp-Asp) domain-containing protein